MFRGLSAFPLSPLVDGVLDETAFVRLIERLVTAGVDSICVLGSTGNYAYLRSEQRARIVRLGVEHAGRIPVIAGVGALTTDHVLSYVEDAQKAGASGLLLPPMSYQPLQDDEVFSLYEAVARSTDIPLCVYDNPSTTHFEFSDELHGRIAQLPHVGSIKIPGVPSDPAAALNRVKRLRAKIPEHVTIGVSGDALAAKGLNAGCEVWYSVIGGLFPEQALAITRAAQAGRADEAVDLCDELEPVWQLYKQHGGSLRVIASAAEQLGFYGLRQPRPRLAVNRRGVARIGPQSGPGAGGRHCHGIAVLVVERCLRPQRTDDSPSLDSRQHQIPWRSLFALAGCEVGPCGNPGRGRRIGGPGRQAQQPSSLSA